MLSEQEHEKLEKTCNMIAKKIFKFSKKTVASELKLLDLKNENNLICSIVMIFSSLTFNMLMITKKSIEMSSKNEIDLEKMVDACIEELQEMINKEISLRKLKEKH